MTIGVVLGLSVADTPAPIEQHLDELLQRVPECRATLDAPTLAVPDERAPQLNQERLARLLGELNIYATITLSDGSPFVPQKERDKQRPAP